MVIPKLEMPENANLPNIHASRKYAKTAILIGIYYSCKIIMIKKLKHLEQLYAVKCPFNIHVHNIFVILLFFFISMKKN